jgi:hypothetical protein
MSLGEVTNVVTLGFNALESKENLRDNNSTRIVHTLWHLT